MTATGSRISLAIGRRPCIRRLEATAPRWMSAARRSRRSDQNEDFMPIGGNAGRLCLPPPDDAAPYPSEEKHPARQGAANNRQRRAVCGGAVRGGDVGVFPGSVPVIADDISLVVDAVGPSTVPKTGSNSFVSTGSSIVRM
jgi:hypothetical protein